MSDFDTIKQRWHQRSIPATPPNGFEKVLEKEKYLHSRQALGQWVLSITVLVLVGFSFYTSAHEHPQFFLGLLLMIGSLTLRIGIEFLYKIRKDRYRMDQDMIQYKRQLSTYYRRRKYIHYLLTPIVFTAYIIGFQMLLPTFKENLSSGFYTYIVVSSWIIFAALVLLIAVQVRKELKIFSELSSD